MKFNYLLICAVFLLPNLYADLSDDIVPEKKLFEEIKSPIKKQKNSTTKPKESLKKMLNRQMKDAKNVKNTKNKECKVYFKGDQFRGSRENSLIELKGNVVVTRCGLEVRSNEARIFLNNAGTEVTEIRAEGNVRLKNYDQRLKEHISASGNQLRYYKKPNTISLIGTKVSKASLKKGKDKFYGPTILYDIDSGWVKAKKVEGVVHGGSFQKNK